MKGSSVRKGKYAELFIGQNLLEAQYDVYPPLVDDAGIDYIVKTDKGYKELQVRSFTGETEGDFAVPPKRGDMSNLFLVCVLRTDAEDVFWAIPYKEIGHLKNVHISLKNKRYQKFFQWSKLGVPTAHKQKKSYASLLVSVSKMLFSMDPERFEKMLSARPCSSYFSKQGNKLHRPSLVAPNVFVETTLNAYEVMRRCKEMFKFYEEEMGPQSLPWKRHPTK